MYIHIYKHIISIPYNMIGALDVYNRSCCTFKCKQLHKYLNRKCNYQYINIISYYLYHKLNPWSCDTQTIFNFKIFYRIVFQYFDRMLYVNVDLTGISLTSYWTTWIVMYVILWLVYPLYVSYSFIVIRNG